MKIEKCKFLLFSIIFFPKFIIDNKFIQKNIDFNKKIVGSLCFFAFFLENSEGIRYSFILKENKTFISINLLSMANLTNGSWRKLNFPSRENFWWLVVWLVCISSTIDDKLIITRRQKHS